MPLRQDNRPSLCLENVSVIRGNRLVLNGFSLKADAGDILWIRGANGAGKSTLLRVTAGLLPSVAGRIAANGSFALADENLGLDVNLPLEKALRFWAGLDRADSCQLNAAMSAMDLLALAPVPVRFLSNGQRKRAILAQTIVSDAAIWLLDEPYNGLDSANMARLDEVLLRHGAAGGIALVAAHQAPTINVADSILLDRPPLAA